MFSKSKAIKAFKSFYITELVIIYDLSCSRCGYEIKLASLDDAALTYKISNVDSLNEYGKALLGFILNIPKWSHWYESKKVIDYDGNCIEYKIIKEHYYDKTAAIE